MELTNYENRKLEWGLAIGTILYGLFLLAPPVSMSGRGYAGVLSIFSEFEWARLFLSAGIVHVVALQINGKAAWTPFARLVAIFINGQVFIGFAMGFAKIDLWLTAVFIYLWVGIVLCGMALVSAARDCGHEYAIWKACRKEK